MKISFVRGAYLNNFEGQNYALPITGYSSLFPLDANVPFPLVKLPSIADLQKPPFLNKPIKYIANRTLGDSQILFGLENYIRGSDIVHVADPHYYYSYQAARLKAEGAIKKLVSTWWETIPFNNESTPAKKRIKRYVMSQVNMFVCYTERAKNCLIAEGITEERIKVIPLGVDLEYFKPVKKNESNRFTILFVGRLVEEKGILDLYEAFKMVSQNEQQVMLRIVGAGPLENRVQKLIQKDGFQNRVIIEHKSYKEMPSVFQQADILCVPSKNTKTWEEQYGMVFVEAMASGIPIISYATGSIPRVVGNAGLFAKENNSNELFALIIQIIRAKDLSAKLGTIGRERAEKVFDTRKTRNEIYKLYKTLDTNMNITAIILAKNEENVIKKAIQSVSFCDEILVIDDESTDSTGITARETGATVLSHSLHKNFAEQRNWAMEQAKNEWVLFVDADEEVGEELKSELLKSNLPLSSYSIPRRDYFWNRELKHGETLKARTQGIVRFMKKNSGVWRREVHEEYTPVEAAGKLTGFINHYSHESLSSFIEDINRYSSLRAIELEKKGKRVSIFELMFYPFGKFMYTYFLLGGFLDGPAGFAYSFVMSFHSFLVRAKLLTKSYV